jgi:hypothetical protein
MPPISPDNTQRFFLDYTTCGYDHTMLCRAGSTVTPADAGATMAAFLAELDSQVRLVTITGFRSAAPGTNITVPQTWPGAATYGDGAGSAFESAQYIDFIGRGATGHRVRVALFGAINVQVGGDYRMSSAESTVVADAIAALTSDADIFLDVDYEIPVWHAYANLGVNAYWRNKIR